MTYKTRREKLDEMARAAAAGMKKRGALSELEWSIEEKKRDFGKEQMASALKELPPENTRPKPCPLCGENARLRAKDVERTFTSLSGTHTLCRNFHYCEKCKHGFFPRDEFLGLPPAGDLSAELEKLVLDLGVNDPFQIAEQRWQLHHRLIPLSDNQFRQVVKRVGQTAYACDPALLQMAAQEPSSSDCEILYIMNDGGMVPMNKNGEWAETKLGMVFRSEKHLPSDEEGTRGQIVDARYAAHLGEQADFKVQLKAAIAVEKRSSISKMVWLADGALGNWRTASELAATAIQILDFHHAIEHAMTCEKALLGEESPELVTRKKQWETQLLESSPKEHIALAMHRLDEAKTATQVAAVNDLVRYYRNNERRMNYRDFIAQGFLIGSGPIEAAHRHVIQPRMKRSGQHWSYPGGRRMARLRAIYRTAGPDRFLEAIRWAHRETLRTPVPTATPRKRYASNR